MNASESRQIEKALFDTALAIADPGTRQQFLAVVCGNDPARHARLISLLDAAHRGEKFFREATKARTLLGAEAATEIPAAPTLPATDTPRGEGPGSQIGLYTLLERIGEGGWGVVYSAEQRQPVRRRVAIKIIRLGLDTEKVVARFEMERQALALMDHPNIARVLDAGATDSGRPYFVMELVHGLRITEHCDGRRLGLRQRIELFIDVCFAIQHAHQKGVIHRDIKPSNVLVSSVDGVDVPKVIDFGIVRAIERQLTGETSITGGDQLIGTPAYMSPEQAEGSPDLDTRSDVYSLGVLLCELLTGKTPFDGKRLAQAGMVEMISILREEEPPAPSALLANRDAEERTAIAARRGLDPSQHQSAVRGDLDGIILKALAKDRSARYDTVNGLARDLERYLRDEPVLARPPGRLYLLGKFARRNKLVIASAAVVALALVAGLAVSSWFYLREKDARTVQVRLRESAEKAQANEARLLQQSKVRESVSRVAILLAEGKTEEADQLLAKTPLSSIEPSIEAANVFRTLGDWNAIRQRWRQAADCYKWHDQANQLRSGSMEPILLLSVAPTLMEAGDVAGYVKLRDSAVTRTNAGNEVAAAIVIKACLLLPADEPLLQRLKPSMDRLTTFMSKDDLSRSSDPFQSAFMAMSLGLMQYRRGDFTQAMEWNRRCEAYPNKNQARSAVAHTVSAMAAHQFGDFTRARSELSEARTIFAGSFTRDESHPRGPLGGGWQDWAIARVLLREAETLMGEQNGASR